MKACCREASLSRERASRDAIERVERELAEETSKRSTGAAIAPPSSLLAECSSSAAADDDDSSIAAAAVVDAATRGPVAANIMARMGYKHGGGLGRNEQGISEALAMKKTGKYGGVIINSARGPLVDVFDDSDDFDATEPNCSVEGGESTLQIGPQAVPARTFVFCFVFLLRILIGRFQLQLSRLLMRRQHLCCPQSAPSDLQAFRRL